MMVLSCISVYAQGQQAGFLEIVFHILFQKSNTSSEWVYH